MTATEDERATVLIVEDYDELARLFEGWLEATYTVEVASDRATASDLVDETVDVVLLDRNLPDGREEDVLQYIRDAGYGCQVAMVTAVEPDFSIIEMGFDDYLIKPASKEELQQTVERLLAHAEYGDAVQELYALTSKKGLLEAQYKAEELEANDEYATLEARIEALNEDLNETVDTFTERQFLAEYTRIGSSGAGD